MIVVSHGAILAAAFKSLLEIPAQRHPFLLENASLSRLEIDGADRAAAHAQRGGALERDRHGGGRRPLKAHASSSKIASISTATPRGSVGAAMALRAPMPASGPKICPKSSLQPLITAG